jgi:hypothetical protein
MMHKYYPIRFWENDLTRCDLCGEVACCWYAINKIPCGRCSEHEYGASVIALSSPLNYEKISRLEAETLQAALVIYEVEVCVAPIMMDSDMFEEL